jgi:hypothetical protein
MKFIITAITLLVTAWQINAQDLASKFPKAEFVEQCKAAAAMDPNLNAGQFCDCMYSGIVKNFTEQDLQVFQNVFGGSLSQEQAMQQLMANPKVMQLLYGCMSGGAGTETAAVQPGLSDAQMAEMKSNFTKECAAGIKKDKSASKSVNAKTTCACVWDKVVESNEGIGMVLRINDADVQKTLEQFSAGCISQ